MNETELNTLVTIIGIIVGIVALVYGGKSLYKKYVGRDDNSVTIKDSEIKDSFNGRK